MEICESKVLPCLLPCQNRVSTSSVRIRRKYDKDERGRERKRKLIILFLFLDPALPEAKTHLWFPRNSNQQISFFELSYFELKVYLL